MISIKNIIQIRQNIRTVIKMIENQYKKNMSQNCQILNLKIRLIQKHVISQYYDIRNVNQVLVPNIIIILSQYLNIFI
ncbi:hypothetical protein pb186bvf_005717 [Paramecium bursaria]